MASPISVDHDVVEQPVDLQHVDRSDLFGRFGRIGAVGVLGSRRGGHDPEHGDGAEQGDQ